MFNINIIPIEEDEESQKRLNITEEDLENKKQWEMLIDVESFLKIN